jgi:hypothetical protein
MKFVGIEIKIMNNITEKEIELAIELFGTKPSKSVKTNLFSKLANFVVEDNFDVENPPFINKYSEIGVWQKGLAKIQPPQDYDNFYFTVLKETENRITCIVWTKNDIPEEAHIGWKESILLLEGSCDFKANGVVTHYEAGTYIDVPDTDHEVIVTSAIPLKFIVQRLKMVA